MEMGVQHQMSCHGSREVGVYPEEKAQAFGLFGSISLFGGVHLSEDNWSEKAFYRLSEVSAGKNTWTSGIGRSKVRPISGEIYGKWAEFG